MEFQPMKIKALLVTLPLVSVLVSPGVKAQLTLSEAEQLLNLHCNDSTQIANVIGSLIDSDYKATMSPVQCAQLRRNYNRALHQHNIRQQRSYQQPSYRQRYRRVYGHDGSFMEHNLESLRESNCLASSTGCP
ncbi:UNVERIFIED_CONTAM: hypothetical protein BEN50_15745 [Euhalothece sp. KZN 001]